MSNSYTMYTVFGLDDFSFFNAGLVLNMIKNTHTHITKHGCYTYPMYEIESYGVFIQAL